MFQRLHGHPAGTQKAGRIAGQIQNRGFHADRTRAAVDQAFNFALHILHDFRRAGTAWPPGEIRAGGGDGDARLPDQGQRRRMVGTADRHGIQSRRHGVRDAGVAFENQRQRAGPEFPGQNIGQRGNVLTVTGKPLLSGKVQNQGIVQRSALRLKNPAHGFFVQRVRAEAVYRFRWNRH